MDVVRSTLGAMLLAQAIRPIAAEAGPVGEYAAQLFAQLIMTNVDRGRG